MASQIEVTPELSDYLRAVSLREDPILRELRVETAAYPAGTAMQVQAEEGQLLAFLITLCGARNVLEIGTFTGYSTLCMARAAGPDGRVVTCDVTDKWAGVGAPFWKRAEVADRIELRVGRAVETLPALRAERGADSFDFAFIDADKVNYPRYYQEALWLVRPGGLIVVDNTLLGGQVTDETRHDPDTVAIRELNEMVRDDDRVDLSMLMIADGVTLVRKRPR
ncbi:class I SAM-dependent methyltransferase [Actinoplanes sp. DH11]|uniref:O-methyltransferase n=1 Tax=Actinoplanes sp. DH11 TaxID=2857011 RepID=UPI001E31F481|nr:class I SAM-dependent methyltransferase [Actinoplanes sp. DH11]